MKNPTVMIIDDEEDIARLTAKRIRAGGYEVVCIFKGEEAFEAVKKIKPALVLLDLWLPGISGIDIYKEIQSDHALQNIPIVFFSADPSQENYCLQKLGAKAFIKKPYDALHLIHLIDETIAR